jgi:hypothetical protein
MLQLEHLTALRIHARHHMLDGAVLAGGVHGLKDRQQAMAVVDVEQTLHLRKIRSHFVDRCAAMLT